MSILKDKICPKCHAKDALHICAWTGAVNCGECTETIRFLTKEEKNKFVKTLKDLGAMTYLREDNP